MLLHHRRQGAKSPLERYLQQLPDKVDVPVLWDYSKLQILQYPYLIHQVRACQCGGE